jgi:hypothetical protein
MRLYGGKGPFSIEIGVTGIEQFYWPKAMYDPDWQPAIEDELVARMKVREFNEETVGTVVQNAAAALRHAFGYGPYRPQELEKILKDPLRQ